MDIEKLINHPYIWRGEGRQPSWNTCSTGFEALDQHLPGGGWPATGLTEIVVDQYGIGELSLLMPALVRVGQPSEQGGGWIVWVSPPFIPYAPALHRQGLDLSRVLLVHKAAAQGRDRSTYRSRCGSWDSPDPEFFSTLPGRRHDSLWAMEQALRFGSCAVVLAWVQSADETALRRLQLAAEEGQCWAVLFRPLEALNQRSPAVLRIRLMRANGLTHVKILKCRGGRPGVIPIELQDQNEAQGGCLGSSEW